MTTFAELKTALARDLRDPSGKTFDTDTLGDLLNAGIAEVSRVAPQKFVETISYTADGLTYPLKGGTENSLVNGSFESGDTDTVLDAFTLLDDTDGGASTDGWLVRAGQSFEVKFARGANAKHGRRYGIVRVPAAQANAEFYQDVPVNPDTVYTLTGWAWFGGATALLAGLTGCRLKMDTLDSNFDVVTPNVVYWDTTSSAPVYRNGSYTIPSSGVSYLRVSVIALGTPTLSIGSVGFDDLRLLEADASTLVARINADTIEPRRVEIWDEDLDPPRMVDLIQPAAGEYEYSTDTGWTFWDGNITIPYRYANAMTEGQHVIKVYGYAPYDPLTTDAQVTDLTTELEHAVRTFARLEALQRLILDRDLFTQWQTASNNTDVSAAALMNSYAGLNEQWRRTKRELTVLREG